MAVTFVYRSHYEGPLSRRVVRFDDASVLAWFQRVWAGARDAPSPRAFIKREMGGGVYGFSSLFEAAKEKKIAAPRTLKQLEKLLDEHLYVEGEVRLDEHSLRVLTDDDEVMLAYFLFDEQAAPPDRVAFLLRDSFPLPTTSKQGRFKSPVEATPLLPGGKGKGRTWAVILTFYDSESFPSSPPSVFEGIRLPDLLGHLRSVTPAVEREGTHEPDEEISSWPLELRLLRAAIRQGDDSLAQALRRVAAYPLSHVGSSTNHTLVGVGPQPGAWAEFERLARKFKPDSDPEKLLIDASPHLLQAALHQTSSFGYQQLFLFDDLWAAANHDLAASLLRFASGWDPWTDGEDDDEDDDEDD